MCRARQLQDTLRDGRGRNRDPTRWAMSAAAATPNGQAGPEAIQTDIPARLDRLPWSRFHWLLVIALGVTWVLDGLEGTIVAAINPVLTQSYALGLNTGQVGFAVTSYLLGAIGGALFFGHLTDRLGRKK